VAIKVRCVNTDVFAALTLGPTGSLLKFIIRLFLVESKANKYLAGSREMRTFEKTRTWSPGEPLRTSEVVHLWVGTVSVGIDKQDSIVKSFLLFFELVIIKIVEFRILMPLQVKVAGTFDAAIFQKRASITLEDGIKWIFIHQNMNNYYHYNIHRWKRVTHYSFIISLFLAMGNAAINSP